MLSEQLKNTAEYSSLYLPALRIELLQSKATWETILNEKSLGAKKRKIIASNLFTVKLLLSILEKEHKLIKNKVHWNKEKEAPCLSIPEKINQVLNNASSDFIQDSLFQEVKK